MQEELAAAQRSAKLSTKKRLISEALQKKFNDAYLAAEGCELGNPLRSVLQLPPSSKEFVFGRGSTISIPASKGRYNYVTCPSPAKKPVVVKYRKPAKNCLRYGRTPL